MAASRPQNTVVLSADEVEFLVDGGWPEDETLELFEDEDDLEDAPTGTWVKKGSEVEALKPSQESAWWKAARQGLRASSPSADTEKREARMSWWEAARLGLRASDDG